MNSKFDDDKFSMTNVSLLDENISSPRNLTSSPAPLSGNIGRSSDRRFSTMNVDELAVAGTSLKSQESVSYFYLLVWKKYLTKFILDYWFLNKRELQLETSSILLDRKIKWNFTWNLWKVKRRGKINNSLKIILVTDFLV